MDAHTGLPRLYLDAELRPHRSMSGRGAVWLLVPVTAINLAFAVFFLVLKAPIVPPFLGLDVIALGAALWFSFRATRTVERVQVSADEISVTRERGRAVERVWTSAPAFTRVRIDEPDEDTVVLRLTSKGRSVDLAGALGPVERRAFGRELQAALAAARAERWPG